MFYILKDGHTSWIGVQLQSRNNIVIKLELQARWHLLCNNIQKIENGSLCLCVKKCNENLTGYK